MKIYIDGVLQNFPEWIKVDSSSGGVSTESETLNDVHGEVYRGEAIKAKTFSCSGVIPNVNSVDAEVSRLQSLLAGKELVVYRTDDTELFSRCRMIGDVKASYYSGIRIGKTFSISFTLKAHDGFMYSEGQVINLVQGSNVLVNTGNVETPVSFQITGPKTLSGTLFSCNGASVTLDEAVELTTGQQIVINDSGMFLLDTDLTDKISDESILKPILLGPGNNLISANVAAVMVFNPRYR
jgi:hypothetical protein